MGGFVPKPKLAWLTEQCSFFRAILYLGQSYFTKGKTVEHSMSCSTQATMGMSSAVWPGNMFIVLLCFSSNRIHLVSLILFLNYNFWGQELSFLFFIWIFLNFNIILHIRFTIHNLSSNLIQIMILYY